MILFANNAISSLAAPLTALSTVIQLQPGGGAVFPTPTGGDYFVMTLINQTTQTTREIIHVTGRATDTLTVVRGQESTPALIWAVGDLAANLWTAGQFAALVQAAFTVAAGDVTGPFSALLIVTHAVGNAKLAQMPAGTLKANLTGSPADAADDTLAAVAAALSSSIVGFLPLAGGNMSGDLVSTARGSFGVLQLSGSYTLAALQTAYPAAGNFGLEAIINDCSNTGGTFFYGAVATGGSPGHSLKVFSNGTTYILG